MDLSKLQNTIGVSGGFDPGAAVKAELEEAISPITQRIDRLEKKLELLLLAVERVEKLLKTMQPVVELIKKIPFVG